MMAAEETEDSRECLAKQVMVSAYSQPRHPSGHQTAIHGDKDEQEEVIVQLPGANLPAPPPAGGGDGDGTSTGEEVAVPAPPPSSPASLVPESSTGSAATNDSTTGKQLPPVDYTIMPDSAHLVSESPPLSVRPSGLVSPTYGRGHASTDRSDHRRSMRRVGNGRDEAFKKRLIQHSQKDFLFELHSDGTYEIKEMTVRQVFNYVQEIVAPYSLESRLSPQKLNAPDTPTGRGSYRMQRMLSVGSSGPVRTRPNPSNAAGVLASSLNLHQRDMRQLFSSQSKSEPAFSVRRNCILINFETLRGIVLVDRLLLVVDNGADSILMEVQNAISESTEDVCEFELKAVEALLDVSSRRLAKDIRDIEGPVKKIMQILEGHHNRATSAENNDKFRVLSHQISVLENRAKARRRALTMNILPARNQILEDDTDLAMMNLTRMFQSPEDYVPPLSSEVLEDHEEMELLLEAYLQDINTTYNGLELLRARVRSTEALVMVKLDIARNRILTAGLVFSMASTCFTLGTLVSGLFGMNLYSGLEEDHRMFTIVAVTTACCCSLAFCCVFTFFYRQGILVS